MVSEKHERGVLRAFREYLHEDLGMEYQKDWQNDHRRFSDQRQLMSMFYHQLTRDCAALGTGSISEPLASEEESITAQAQLAATVRRV